MMVLPTPYVLLVVEYHEYRYSRIPKDSNLRHRLLGPPCLGGSPHPRLPYLDDFRLSISHNSI